MELSLSRPHSHVYIIDDDRAFGKSLKRLLTCKSIPADYFDSAQSFLDSVPSGQQGIAIIDLHMPGLDGFSLMDKMRELHYAMPSILITGQTQPNTRDAALKRGAIGFLQKPFNEASLLGLIESLENEWDE